MVDLLTLVKEKVSLYRRMQYLLETNAFLLTATSSDIRNKILTGDLIAVTEWLIDTAPALHLGEMPIRQLRTLARRNNVGNYKSLSKMELVSVLTTLLRERNAARERLSQQNVG